MPDVQPERPDLNAWPCHACDAPGLKNLGTRGYCEAHLEAFLGPIRWRIMDGYGLSGVGRLRGVLRPEYGPLVGDLECTTCKATWTGQVGMACEWCEQQLAYAQRFQAELLLTIPDINAAHKNYEGSMRGWAERLQRGVEAGLIADADASRAWGKAVQNVAA